MSTLGYTFSSNEIKFKKDETYTSGGINAVFAAGITKGIHRGFRIIPSATNRFVTIQPDDIYSDHVAIVENSTGFAVTLRKSGSFDIDLSSASFNSKTVVLAIKGSYSTNAATAASIQIYELSPSDTFTGDTDRDYLIVLGSVIVPAGNTVIPAANIKPYKRDYAWDKKSNHLRDWEQIIKNPSFEKSVSNTATKYAADYWELFNLTGTTSKITSTNKNSGQLGYEFAVTSTGAKSGTILQQSLRQPAYSGMEVRIKFYLKRLIASTAGTGLTVSLDGHTTGGINTTPSSMQFTQALNATDGSFTLVEQTLRVGVTDVNYINLSKLNFTISATYSATGPAFAIDDVAVYIEGKQLLVPGAVTETGGAVITNSIILEEQDQAETGQNKALIYYEYAPAAPAHDGGLITFENRNQDDAVPGPDVDIKGVLALGEYAQRNEYALNPRISTPFSSANDFVNILEMPSLLGDTISYRIYASNSDAVFFTVNASFDGTNWVKDLAGTDAVALVLGANSLMLAKQVADPDFSSFSTTMFSFALDSATLFNTFTNGLDFGKSFTSTYSATKPILAAAARASGTSAKTLIFELLGNSPAVKVRFYLTSTGQLELTYNAVYSGTTWTRDAAGQNSTKLLWNGTGIQTFIKTSATNGSAWNDSSWSTASGNTFDISANTVTNIDGIYKVTSATSSFSNPNSTTALTNELRAVNIPKAWGYINVEGGSIAVQDGCNLGDVDVISGRVEITFAANMANATYSTTSNYIGTFGYATSIYSQAADKVVIEVYDRTAGTAIDLSSDDAIISFNVFSRQ